MARSSKHALKAGFRTRTTDKRICCEALRGTGISTLNSGLHLGTSACWHGGVAKGALPNLRREGSCASRARATSSISRQSEAGSAQPERPIRLTLGSGVRLRLSVARARACRHLAIRQAAVNGERDGSHSAAQFIPLNSRKNLAFPFRSCATSRL